MHYSDRHLAAGSQRFECVHRVFEAQADASPEAIAIETGDDTWTYSKLNRYANRIANRLLRDGLTQGALVGTCLRRSPQAIAAMLGILKAGAAYVPFDLGYPVDRLRFMLEDTGLRTMLSDEAGILKLGGMRGNRCSLLDVLKIQADSVAAPRLPGDYSDLAYVMYTSGSTGSPKGVMIEHRGITRLVCDPNYATLGSSDVILQLSPLSFDASTFEIWGALLNGARLILVPHSSPSLTEIAEIVQRQGVTTMWLTSGLFNALVDEHAECLRDLKQLLAGGDVLSVEHVRRAIRAMRRGVVINGYGPTENTTFTCCHKVREIDLTATSIPIGQPVNGTTVHILDKNLLPVAAGESGEIVVSGAGLARGYWKRPELTNEKFVKDTFSRDPNARMYRTGDLGRCNDAGDIEFLGRMDAQLKIRGFRVEPGEVEAALNSLDAVTAAAVVARGESADQKHLCCYFVRKPGEDVERRSLIEYLADRLPTYLIPDEFVELPALPLDVNGKLDRRALIAGKDLEHPGRTDDLITQLPEDQIETDLLRIWKALFEKAAIGLDHDFFELGGHSLLAARMFSQISQKFDKRIPLSAIAQAPTVRTLAALIRDETDARKPPSTILFGNPTADLPLFLFRHPEANVQNFRDLALNLEPYSVYGVQPSDLDSTPLGADSLEELAAKYKAAVRAVQPEGPYFLGGYCAGAQIAYETAQQFTREGEEVAFLGLIDGMAEPDPHELAVQGKLGKALLRWLAGLGWRVRQPDFLAKLIPDLRQFAAETRRARTFRSSGKHGQPLNVAEAFFAATPIHAHSKFPGETVLFRTAESKSYASDSAFGWRPLVEGLITIEDIPGVHDRILDEPHVKVLARKLRTALDLIHPNATEANDRHGRVAAETTFSLR